MSVILEVKNLTIEFQTPNGKLHACQDVSFSVGKAANIGIVGESGSGKTMCCLAILGLLPEEAEIKSGQIIFKGNDLLKADAETLRRVRGNDIAMVFQEPMSSLNPVITVGSQITEAIMTHKKCSYKEAKKETIKLLDKVKLDRPKDRFNDYPHSLSGGQRQRVMIAMAISCQPEILIADEPTTALDVTIQAEILNLLDELQREMHMSVLIVSHDFGVIARLADTVAVMYKGEVVEHESAEKIFKNPRHPYTKALLLSVKELEEGKERLTTLKDVGFLSNE